jgi:aminoglycoside phosphotransferase family enzyme
MSNRSAVAATPSIDAIVAHLRDPAAFPESPRAVAVRETHMAWVFLTDAHAYKLKKPVRFSYLDYSTLAKRRAACAAEVRLNSRLSPWVYEGLVPITVDGRGHLHLNGSTGEVADWLVKMRRLPEAGFLAAAIRRGDLDLTRLRGAAELLAAFFADRPPEPASPRTYGAQLHSTVQQDAGAVVDAALAPQGRDARRVERALTGYLDRHGELMAARAARRVDGHGDLRPEHIALGPPPAVIDCIEFNRAFRLTDPADEYAFLHMETTALGADTVGETFLSAYRTHADDAPPDHLIAFHAARRALLRAKLALWHIDPSISNPEHYRQRASEYLDLADHFISAMK